MNQSNNFEKMIVFIGLRDSLLPILDAFIAIPVT
jgi:hypothetical protein